MGEVINARVGASVLAAWSRLTRSWRAAVPALLACRRDWLRQAAVWYAIFAAYAGAVAAFSGPGLDQWWGIWAAGGYAAAAVLAACRPGARGRRAALAAAVAGAVAAPVIWLATQEPGTSDGTVVTRSAWLLVRHGTPYLPAAALAHGGWLAYNPYLPVMSLFGLPRAAGLPGLAGDTRPWLAAVTFVALLLAFRAVAPGRSSPSPAGAAALAAFATASPLLAFPLALSITDPPITALVVLALALLTRPAPPAGPAAATVGGRARRALAGRRIPAAAIALGVACAMKYTAWPALAVLAAMTAARDGARVAVRLAAASVVTALILVGALAPAAWTAPAALIDNTVAYPLGLTSARSPAQSPLPGHILASLGPAGHAAAIALLTAVGLAIAWSLFIRPPADPRAATRRLALGLILLFAFAPNTRFGYLAYPLSLYGWLALTRPVPSQAASPARAGQGDAASKRITRTPGTRDRPEA